MSPSSRRLPVILLLVTVLALPVAQDAAADWIGNVRVAQPGGMHMSYDDDVIVEFDYEITSPDGARIWCYPYNSGGPTPPTGYGGSPLYTGTGSGSTYFTGSGTPGYINRVAVYARDAVTNELLLEIVVPTHVYLGEHGVFDMSFSHTQPSWLAPGEDLVIDFNATTPSSNGAYVYMRPMTDGAITPGYAASGGAYVPTGTASGSQYFSFSSTEPDVDAIRVQMVEAGTSALLEEFFVPVRFGWRNHGVANISVDPAPPAWLPSGTEVYTTFDYHSVNPAIRAWAWGEMDGEWIQDTAYQPSATLPPTGSASRWFRVNSSVGTESNEVRIVLDDDSQFPNLFDESVRARYHFGPHAVYNIQFDKPQPAILDHSHRVNVTFDYTTNEAGGVRIWTRPFTDGAESPSFAVDGSLLHPVGTGSATSYFRISVGDVEVDQLRFRMATADGSITLLEFFVDVTYFWGQEGVFVAAPPDRRQIPTLGLARPNPFNPSTTIDWSLPVDAEAHVRIYDVTGRLVRTLATGPMTAGPHQRTWDGRDDTGRQVSSGVYYYQLSTADFTEAKKMTLVK